MLERARQTISQVSGTVKNFRRVMEDQQVQELGAIAAADHEKLPNLQQYLSGRIPELIDVTLFEPNLNQLRGNDMGASGYAVLDMLMNAREGGLAPVQMHGKGAEAYLALATRVGEAESPSAYLFVKVKPEAITRRIFRVFTRSRYFFAGSVQWQVFTNQDRKPFRATYIQTTRRIYAHSRCFVTDRGDTEYPGIKWGRLYTLLTACGRPVVACIGPVA